MALVLTRPNPSIDSTTDAGQALDQYLDGDIDQLFTNDNELYNGNVSAKASYSSLDDRLDAIEASLTEPEGYIKYGTNAERLAYSSPLDGMRWHETDTGRDFIYDATTASWIEVVSSSLITSDNKVASKTLPTGEIVGTTDTQTLTNKTLDAAVFTGANQVTGTITVPEPTTSTEPATKNYVDLRVCKGFITGLYPVYNSSSSIDIAPGMVWIGDEVYELGSSVTLSPTLTASSWHYIYVSATPASNSLTASDFSVSTTAPTRSETGWYDGSNNRCVGFFYVDSTPNIVEFNVISNWWAFYNPQVIVNTTSPPTSPTNANAGPTLPTMLALSEYVYAGADATLRVEIYSPAVTIDDSSATGYWYAVQAGAGGATAVYDMHSHGLVPTLDGTITYFNGANASAIRIYLRAVSIPDGLGRR